MFDQQAAYPRARFAEADYDTDPVDPDVTDRYRAWMVKRVLQGFVLLLLLFVVVIGADTLIASRDLPDGPARSATAR